MRLSIRRSYELGTLCARAALMLGEPGAKIQINSETMADGGVHQDKRECGPVYKAAYNNQVLRNLGVSTRATFRTIVKETEKHWRT